MKRTLAAAAVLALAAALPAYASEDLAKSSGCLTCHNVSGKKMGPGFKEVAAKYKGDAKAEETILANLGKKPHPTVKASADDQKKLVKWILTL